MKTLRSQSGFTVVEVLIGLAIFVVIFLFIYETLTLFFVNQVRLLESTQALYLAEAGQEYVRHLRDEDWGNITGLSTGTTYYFSVSTTTIATTTSPETIGKFTRSFVLWPAYRDGDDDLVASTTAGASADSGSYMLTTKVTWDTDEVVTLHSFIGNIQN